MKKRRKIAVVFENLCKRYQGGTNDFGIFFELRKADHENVRVYFDNVEGTSCSA